MVCDASYTGWGVVGESEALLRNARRVHLSSDPCGGIVELKAQNNGLYLILNSFLIILYLSTAAGRALRACRVALALAVPVEL